MAQGFKMGLSDEEIELICSVVEEFDWYTRTNSVVTYYKDVEALSSLDKWLVGYGPNTDILDELTASKLLEVISWRLELEEGVGEDSYLEDNDRDILLEIMNSLEEYGL